MIPCLALYWALDRQPLRRQAMEPSRGKSICVPFESEDPYAICVVDPDRFRQYLMDLHSRHPELLPAGFEQGFLIPRQDLVHQAAGSDTPVAAYSHGATLPGRPLISDALYERPDRD